MPRDSEFLAECRALQREISKHPTLVELRAASAPDLPERLRRLLEPIRLHAGPAPAPAPSPALTAERAPLHLVHWNIEHGNWYEKVEAALLQHPDLRDADLVMLNEADLGMARSGNRDVTADLGRALGRHAAWAPLFLETTAGRDLDVACAGGIENQEALFGLAILSRWPLASVRTIELPSPEDYQFTVERMFGRHVALIADVERPGAPFVAITVHLEVHRTRAHRAEQMRVLLEALRGETRPIVLAGDFNSHTFERGRFWDPWLGALTLALGNEASLRRRFLHPDRGPARERVFDQLAAHGFEWDRFADHEPTLQLHFDRIDEARALPRMLRTAIRHGGKWAERRGALRLDWIAGRGWKGGRGLTVEGLRGAGKASDHSPIVAWLE